MVGLARRTRLSRVAARIAHPWDHPIETVVQDNTESTVIWSRDRRRRYRYWLSRQWSDAAPLIMLMLNPSTADAFKNDRTVARVCAYAREAGYGSVVVLNIAAFRATKPAVMLAANNPLGFHNRRLIRRGLRRLSVVHNTRVDVLLAYGANAQKNPVLLQQVSWVHKACVRRARMLYLEVNRDGTFRHPLYIPSPWRPRRFVP